MIRIICESLQRELKTDRVIAEINGTEDGPVLIFTAGLHGNEPTGVFALKDVFDEFNGEGFTFHGKAIALAGNMKALHEDKRFLREDLNRMWTKENIGMVKNGFRPELSNHPELLEMHELYHHLDKHFSNASDQEYFIDLHTTSAPTKPFIALSNIHHNLDFALNFAMPVISNIDHFIKSPMLAYANHTGDKHISLAFEAGQHHHTEAFENHKNFIRLCLYYAGCLINNSSFLPARFVQKLFGPADLSGQFEIVFHYVIGPDEQFVMKPGLANFQQVHKGDTMASSNGKDVKATHNGYIFMPLYQALGNDGFFIIQKIH